MNSLLLVDLAVYFLVALNVYMSMRIIKFSDMTCDGAFALGACSFVMSYSLGFNFFIALLISVIFGGLAGLTTAFLATKFKIDSLLAGIITVTSIQSVNIKLLGGEKAIKLAQMNIPTISPIFVVILFISIYGLMFFFLSSKFGLAVRGVGGNPNIANKFGISYARITKMVLTIGNAIVGIAGAIYVTMQKEVTISIGSGSLIIGMIAMVVGEKFIKVTNVFSLLTAVIAGTLFYKFLLLMVTHDYCLGVDPAYANLLTGIFIIIVYILKDSRDQDDRD